MPYVVVWRFDVRPEAVERFESVYGPRGEWARLFARHTGFVSVELLREAEGRYATIDRWRSRADHDAMHALAAGDYARLDEACAGLTIDETKLGAFDVIE